MLKKITRDELGRNEGLRNFLFGATISPSRRGDGVFISGNANGLGLEEYGIILPKGGMIIPNEKANDLKALIREVEVMEKIRAGEEMGGYGLHIQIEGDSLVGYQRNERLGILRPWDKEQDGGLGSTAVPFIVHLGTGWSSGGYRQGLQQYVRQAAFVLVDGWPKGRPRPNCSVCGGRGEIYVPVWGDVLDPKTGCVSQTGTRKENCRCING